MKKTVMALSALLLLSGVACKEVVVVDGGGSGSVGGGYYPSPTPAPHVWTHSELADEFVRRINSEIASFDISLVKTYTLQQGYIVVYDWQYGTYDAYYIDAFNPAGDVASYYNSYENWTYYDLSPTWNGNYYDPITGVLFEKQTASGKNLSKMKAFKEFLTIKKMGEKLQAEYGLSAEKAENTARFAYKVQNSPAGSYNNKDYDAFAKELTGSTITDFQKDVQKGDMTSLAKRIELAGETTGMGPEGVNKLINDMFLK